MDQLIGERQPATAVGDPALDIVAPRQASRRQVHATSTAQLACLACYATRVMDRIASALNLVVLSMVVACGGSPPPQPAAPSPGDTTPGEGEDAHAHHDGHDHHHHQGAQPLGHRFEQADKWVPVFEGPERDRWQQPERIVAALALAPGMMVADVGAGTGYLSAHLAPAVTASGKVIAVDVEPDMVRHLRERFAASSQVEARLGTPEDPKLAPASVDRIVVLNTWHHIPERVAYAKKLAQALRPGGFVLIVDFTMEATKGPPRNHRLEPSAVEAELAAAGLATSRVDAGLPEQYVIKGAR
jgi:SAM-dependent methyltransferase